MGKTDAPEWDSCAMAALGTELQGRAPEIASAVLDWWLEHRDHTEAPTHRMINDILHTVELGTVATSRFLITQQLPTSAERDSLSAPGESAVQQAVAVDELTKLYLVTRDVTCRELVNYTRQLGLSQDALDAAIRVVRRGSDSAIVGVVRRFDVARRRLQEQLASERELMAHHAVHDDLTGLPNRTLLMDRLEQLVAASRSTRRGDRRQHRFAVLFVDIDRFKAVNDVAGHRVGDELLVAVAGRLGAVIRGQDTLARLGGDEFVVLCPELSQPAAEAAAVAERITAVMAQPFHLAGADEEFFVSASVGVGVASPGDTAESVLSRADSAMYAAKRRGGSSHQVYDDSVDSTLRRRPQLINDLHVAAQSGQLSLHYQPVMDLGTDRVRAMEALARWEHPRFGPVPPVEFIPLAEETGLIVTIGRWAITRALTDCARWQAGKWPGVAVAVNVSGRQFSDTGLAAHLEATLQATGLDPSDVILEITESVLVSSEAATVAALDALRATGVGLAIDDFGTGYSSLAYLRRLPVQSVKVDRSFIAGIDSSGGDVAIVAAMVELAHSLGLSVVAEGVETVSELEVVRRAGCDNAQGYLLGRPAGLDARSDGSQPEPVGPALSA